MTGSLEVRPPTSAPGLPFNYLPAALGPLSGAGDGASRILYLLDDPANAQVTRSCPPPPVFCVLSNETLARPDEIGKRTQEFLGELRMEGLLTLLGPPVMLQEDLRRRAIELPEAELGPETGFRRALVVVDAGLAFWNQRFGEQAAPVRAIAFPGFSAQVPMLGPAEIKDYCQLAKLPDGDRLVLDKLRAEFPESHFGRWRDVQGFWHGTAVADLAENGRVALFGVELPRATVEDRSGDSLTAIMPLVLQSALVLTGSAGLADLPLDILLPYAFTGGPHDGSHPVAVMLANLLAAAKGRRRQVRLFLPAGNHRQDACHAVLPGGGAETVDWHLPPDDYSPNTVEVVIHGGTGQRVRLVLSAPTGQSAEVSLWPEEISLIALGGQVMGAVARSADRAGSARLRLALSPTAAAQVGPPVSPAGRWAIGVGSQHQVNLWILRDDRDLHDDGPWPRRGSRFAHPDYEERDEVGRWRLDDLPDAVVRRAGTSSVMATVPGEQVVEASELPPQAAPRPAHYSGLRADGQPTALAVVVDVVADPPGQPCLGNGTSQRFRMSGTSAAVALAVRDAP